MFRKLRNLVLLLLPVAGISGFHLAFPGKASPVLLGGAGLLYAGILALRMAWFTRSSAEVRALTEAVGEAERTIARERTELQTRINFLAAEREISLVLNEDLEFAPLVDRVLSITQEALGGRPADEIELYLREKEGGDPVLRAVRRAGATEMVNGRRDVSDPLVRASLQGGRMLFSAQDQMLEVVTPLSSDGLLIGAVRARTLLEGDASIKAMRAEQLSKNLEELSRFLALAVKTRSLYARAVEDGLTGLATRRHFHELLENGLLVAQRYRDPLSLVMVDIDHFKKVNDTHGHPAGDRVLKGVADVIKRGIRKGSDAAGFRYGGEEMGLILPKTPLEKALEVGERLRKTVEEKGFAGGIRVTVSVGVAEFEPPEKGESFVERVDAALYRAKEGGRNRVISAERSRISKTKDER